MADMGGSFKCRLVVEKGKCENTGQEEPTVSIRGLSFPGFKQLCARSFLVVLKTPEVGICFSQLIEQGCCSLIFRCAVSLF